MGERRGPTGPAEPGGPDRVEARLREELRALAGSGAALGPADGRRLVDAGHRRAQRRSVRTAALAAAACLAVVVGGAAVVRAGDGAGTGGRVDSGVAGEGAAPTAVPVPRPPGASTGPSQAQEDAARDGVPPIVAELSPAARVEAVVPALADGDEVWVASRPAADDFDGMPCSPASAASPEDYSVCATEYGEVLVLDADGRIERAYPLPGIPPQWLHVTDRYVYAGRHGDGGLPDSALVRIDRASGEAAVVVLHTGIDVPDVQPDDPEAVLGWLVATPEQANRTTALLEMWSSPGATGTPVESWVFRDPLRIDFAAIDQLVDEAQAGEALENP